MTKLLKKSLVFIFSAVLLLNMLFLTKVSIANTERYSGYGEATPYSSVTNTETINYTRREVEQVDTVNGVPMYMPISGLANSCGAVGGTIIVGFYDKYYNNLIPDYATYISNGRYKNVDAVYVPKVMNEMYTLMRTNVDDVGVSQSDCLNGLQTYVKNKGYSIEYSNIKDNNKVDENLLRSSISNNNPAILFCGKTDVYYISSTSSSDEITCMNLTSGGHVVVAYGLYIVKYYNGNNLFRTDKYANVATGLSTRTGVYMKIESTDWCNGAYSVIIR